MHKTPLMPHMLRVRVEREASKNLDTIFSSLLPSSSSCSSSDTGNQSHDYHVLTLRICLELYTCIELTKIALLEIATKKPYCIIMALCRMIVT